MLSKAQVKYIQSLSHKKNRDEEKLFVAEGPKIAAELIAENTPLVKHVYATKLWMDENKNLVKKINEDQLSVIEEADLERISQLATPNRVLVVMQQFHKSLPIDWASELVVMLDGIQDPGNLGTIIRIADWFGVKHIICSKDCADMYNSKVVQSSMASIGRVNVIYEELEKLLEQQKNNRIYAAVLEGMAVQKISKTNTGILLIGNESKGISEPVLKFANKKITIPRTGMAESLNAAVATGIILSYMLSQ